MAVAASKRTEAVSARHRIVRPMRVSNALGLHLRVAARLVDLARTFEADITFERAGVLADARSVVSLTSLAVAPGDMVSVVATGTDADQALDAFAGFFARGFGEGTINATPERPGTTRLCADSTRSDVVPGGEGVNVRYLKSESTFAS